MPARERSSPRPTTSTPRPGRGAVERLYVYWLVSTALLLLIALTVVIMTRGNARRQNTAIADLGGRVADLEQSLGDLRTAVASLAQSPPAGPQPALPQATEAATAPPSVAPGEGATAPSESPTPSSPEPPQIPSEDALRAQLDAMLRPVPVWPIDVLDTAAASALLDMAVRNVERARWSGATWSRLAVLACLQGREAAAQAFARRAAVGGDLLIVYAEVSVRWLLAQGRGQEALTFATDLIERSQGAPIARVLLSATLLAVGDPASADEVLETIPEPTGFHAYDRFLLARVLIALERWEGLGPLVAGDQETPEELAAEHNFLNAVAMTRANQNVAALALLDGLAPETAAGASAQGAVTASWPIPRPSRYEVELWRGITLMQTRQLETARTILHQAAGLDPSRPEAHFHLGKLEYEAGHTDLAANHLQNALACSANMATAWEALAILAINENNADQALEHLNQALRCNVRRASSHFLIATVHAKLGQAGPAREALANAFRIDPRYRAAAQETDVLLKLFTPAELDEIGG